MTVIGTKGSEDGIIVLDEEHDEGARITLERNGSIAPWSVTCGIYGCFMHTAFASNETEVKTKYDSMKSDLVFLMHEEDSDIRYNNMSDFAERY